MEAARVRSSVVISGTIGVVHAHHFARSVGCRTEFGRRGRSAQAGAGGTGVSNGKGLGPSLPRLEGKGGIQLRTGVPVSTWEGCVAVSSPLAFTPTE